MLKRIKAIGFVVIIFALLLTACDRSASVSPLATATANGGIPFPVASQSQILKDVLAQTQTAYAVNGTMATGTPEFIFATDTPQSAEAATETPVLPATSTPLPPTAVVSPTITPGQPTQFASCSGVPGYGGSVPIVDVAKDKQVTIDGANFPGGQALNVRMGANGTDANGGTIVGTANSGTSGCFSATFLIPAAFSGSPKIAIRVETTNGYYYGYNWFYNTNTK
jgi:hypothetical protein